MLLLWLATAFADPPSLSLQFSPIMSAYDLAIYFALPTRTETIIFAGRNFQRPNRFTSPTESIPVAEIQSVVPDLFAQIGYAVDFEDHVMLVQPLRGPAQPAPDWSTVVLLDYTSVPSSLFGRRIISVSAQSMVVEGSSGAATLKVEADFTMTCKQNDDSDALDCFFRRPGIWRLLLETPGWWNLPDVLDVDEITQVEGRTPSKPAAIRAGMRKMKRGRICFKGRLYEDSPPEPLCFRQKES